MENFVVSARKYRPATFESVVGQEHITSTLRNAISRSQLAHAYLFCGPRGVGKTTCARIFAKAINCLSPGDSEACGECESCRSFNEGRSFNIHELDAASNNSVDDIRSLTEQVRIPPQIGRYSVYIIDEVHMLSAAAFNAFLKTLEEPPAHAVFILATTEKHKIIPTILSRCQIYDFNRIRVEDGVKYLKYIAGKEGVTCDDESLHLIAQKADGGMRDALSMFDKAVSFCGTQLDFRSVAETLNVLDYDTYFNITDRIVEGDYPSVLTAFDGVLRKGFSPQTFAGGLNVHFRDLLMCRDGQTAGLLEVTGSLMERYREQASRCDTGFLFDALSLVTAIDNGLRNATNQRLNVELGLMKLCSQGQKKNIGPDLNPAPQGLSLPELGKAGASADVSAGTSAGGDTGVSGADSTGASSGISGGGSTGAISAGSGGTSGGMSAGASTGQPAANIPTNGAVSSDASFAGTTQPGTTAGPVIEQVPASQVAQNVQPVPSVPGTPERASEGDNIPAREIPAATSTYDLPLSEAAISTAPEPVATIPTNTAATEAADPVTAPASETGIPFQSNDGVDTDLSPVIPVDSAEGEPAPDNSTDSGPVSAPVQEVPVAPDPSQQTARKTVRPTLSGTSINDLLVKPVGLYDVPTDENEQSRPLPASDPAAAEKIEAYREKFLKRLNAERPRLAVAFSEMVVTDNKIKVSVPTPELREEILRNRADILTLLSVTASVTGYLDLEVVIKEDTGPKLPVRVEDKLRYLTEKNPAVTLLRQKLELDLE